MKQLLKSKWKQILSLVLVAMMVVCLCPQLPIVEASATSGEDAIPSDVTFEGLEQTMNATSVEVEPNLENAVGTLMSLGTLQNVENGFKFKVSEFPTVVDNKELWINLYNSTDSVWNGGYNLQLKPTESGLSWEVTYHNSGDAGDDSIEVPTEQVLFAGQDLIDNTSAEDANGSKPWSESASGLIDGGVNYDVSGTGDTNWTISLPKVNYGAYEKVSMSFQATNNWQTIGFIDGGRIADGGGNPLAGMITITNNGDGTLTAEIMTTSPSEETVTYTFTDSDMVNGTKSLPIFWNNGAAYRQMSIGPVVAKSFQTASEETVLYTGQDLIDNTSAEDANGSKPWSESASGLIDGGVNYDVSGTGDTNWTISLPKVNYGAYEKVSMSFQATNNWQTIGFIDGGRIADGGGNPLAGMITITNNGDGTLTAEIMTTSPREETVTYTFTDSDMVNGTKSLPIFWNNGAAYRQMSIGPVVAKSFQTASEETVLYTGQDLIDNTSAEDANGSKPWSESASGLIDGGVNYDVSGTGDTNWTISLPKVNYGAYEKVSMSFQATNNWQTIGFIDGGRIADGGGNPLAGMISITNNGDGTLTAEITATSPREESVTYTFTDSDMINGTKSLPIFWNNGAAYRQMSIGPVNATVSSYQKQVEGASGSMEMPEELEVYAWVSDITETSHVLNLVLNGEQVLSKEMTTSEGVILGTKLYVWSDWGNTTLFSDFTPSDEEENPPAGDDENDILPTDITFESLRQTANVGRIEVQPGGQWGTEMRLGALQSVNNGFSFKISGFSEEADDKDIWVNVYSQNADSIWNAGYNLRFRHTDAGLYWDVMYQKGDNKVIKNGTMSMSDEVEVYVWADDITETSHVLNVVLNDEQVLSQEMTVAEGVELGTNLHVWSAWTSTAVFCDSVSCEGDGNVDNNVPPANEEEMNSPENVTIPSDVTFESLGQTAEVARLDVLPSEQWGTAMSLGTLENIEHGFAFRLGGFSKEADNKELWINVYNPNAGDPNANIWKGGYNLRFWRTDLGLSWDVMIQKDGNNKGIAGANGTIAVPEEAEVYIWLSDITPSGHRLNIALNGKTIVSKKLNVSDTGEGMTLGTNLYVWSNWDNTAVFNEIEAGVEGDANSSNVTFESLLQTAKVDAVRVQPGEKWGTSVSLGTLESTSHGFQFRLSGFPTEADNKELWVNLYNPNEGDPNTNLWKGGYNLRFRRTDAGLTWEVIIQKNGDKLIAGATGTIAVTDEVAVSVWVSDITSFSHKLNIVLNGETILSQKMYLSEKGEGMPLGKNLYVWSGWKTTAIFNNFTEQVWEKAEIPEDIVLDDIGTLSRKNKLKIPTSTNISLGYLRSKNNGFQLCTSIPADAELGVPLKIGFYNLGLDLWNGGYILEVSRNEEGNLKLSLCKGNQNEYIETVTNFTKVKAGETFTVKAWISKDASNPGGHTMHITVNDYEVFTYTSDGTGVLLGGYINAWNNLETTCIVESVETCETFTERYFRLYGNPTAMGDDTVVTVEKETDEKPQNVLGYILGGLAVVAVMAAGTGIVLVRRKKKNRDTAV